MKSIKRQVIIRESDLLKLLKTTIKKDLYNSIEVEPLTFQGIQNDNLIAALRDQPIPTSRPLPDLYEQMLWRQNNLYNRNYCYWHLTMDYPAGQIYVQSRKNFPKEPLFVATFEREIN